MLFKLTGTALQSAQLSIARYCIELEAQSGSVDLAHVLSNLNAEYQLVPPDALNALIGDIYNAREYLRHQRVEAMSRAGYWKFKAQSSFNAKQILDIELAALRT